MRASLTFHFTYRIKTNIIMRALCIQNWYTLSTRNMGSMRLQLICCYVHFCLLSSLLCFECDECIRNCSKLLLKRNENQNFYNIYTKTVERKVYLVKKTNLKKKLLHFLICQLNVCKMSVCKRKFYLLKCLKIQLLFYNSLKNEKFPPTETVNYEY